MDQFDRGHALVVSHGGIVEASAVGCAPLSLFEQWEESCSYCEGVRLHFDGTVCKNVELLKVMP